METRKVSNLPMSEAVTNDTNILVEVGGAFKRIPADEFIIKNEEPPENLAVGWVWKSGYYKSDSGAHTANNSFWCSDSYIAVEYGELYEIVGYAAPGKTTADIATFGARGFFADSAGNYVSGITYAMCGGSVDKYTVPVPVGAAQMYINVWYEKAEDITLEVYRKDAGRMAGKKWASLGDSITNRMSWQPYLNRKYGLVHTNCGQGSTCLGGQGTESLPPFWHDTRLAAVKAADPDIVTILGGANDLVQNVPIGDETQFSLALASKDKNTFIGAYSYIIETLLTWKPKLKIVILGTTWAHNDGKTYNDTLTYTDYSNASRKVAEYYGLPFVDLHAKCGFNKFTMEDAPFNIYSADHIHPNAEGGKVMAACVDEVFRHLFQF